MAAETAAIADLEARLAAAEARARPWRSGSRGRLRGTRRARAPLHAGAAVEEVRKSTANSPVRTTTVTKVSPELDPYALALAQSKELATRHAPKMTNLLHALDAGDTEEAARLVDTKEAFVTAVDESGRTALHLEMERGGTKRVKPGNRGDNPLMVACFMDNLAGATYLTDHSLGKDLLPNLYLINTASNSDGASPLMRALEGKNADIAAMLMDRREFCLAPSLHPFAHCTRHVAHLATAHPRIS